MFDFRFLKGLVLLGLCAFSGQVFATPPPVPPPAADVSLRLKIAAQEVPGWRAVPVNGVLRSGAKFALDVTVARPVYLFVAQRKGAHSSDIVHPPEGDATSASGVAARPARIAFLPASGQWFVLDNRIGEDAVFIIASTAPLPRAQAQKILDAQANAACIRPREPPPVLKDRDRGDVVAKMLDAQGLAILCFPFLHRE